MLRRSAVRPLCPGSVSSLPGRRSARRRRWSSPCRAFLRRRPGRTAANASARPHAHEDLAATFGHELVVLIVGAVVELDDAGARPRRRLALADHLAGAVDGVT